MIFKTVKVKYLRVIYPFGQCFKVLYPPNAQNYIFNGMILSQKIKDVSYFGADGYFVSFLDKDSGLEYLVKLTQSL